MQPQTMHQHQVVPVQEPEAATVADPPPLFPPIKAKRPSPRVERNSEAAEVNESKDRGKACCVAICLLVIFVIVVVVVSTVMFGGDDEDDSDCFGFECSTSSSSSSSTSSDSFSFSNDYSVYDAYSIFEDDGWRKYYYERCYSGLYTCSGSQWRTCDVFEDRCREFY